MENKMQTIGEIEIFGKKYKVLVRQGKTSRFIKLASFILYKNKSQYFDEADGKFLENHPEMREKFLNGNTIKL